MRISHKKPMNFMNCVAVCNCAIIIELNPGSKLNRQKKHNRLNEQI